MQTWWMLNGLPVWARTFRQPNPSVHTTSELVLFDSDMNCPSKELHFDPIEYHPSWLWLAELCQCIVLFSAQFENQLIRKVNFLVQCMKEMKNNLKTSRWRTPTTARDSLIKKMLSLQYMFAFWYCQINRLQWKCWVIMCATGSVAKKCN